MSAFKQLFRLPELRERPGRTLYRLLVTGMLITLCGCGSTGLKKEPIEIPPTYAPAPAESGVLAEMAGRIAEEHGSDHSGFHLLDSSLEGLNWRLALIDSAVSSIDVQTYLWYADNSGRLVLERVVHAA